MDRTSVDQIVPLELAPGGRRAPQRNKATIAFGLGMAIGLAVALGAAPVVAQVETTFDTDLEGWTITGDNDYFWNGIDGNPGGCVEIVDDAAGPWSLGIAPAAYLGDWSAMTAADSLSYDAIHMPPSGQNGGPPQIFRIEGPGGIAEVRQIGFPANVWNHFSVPIDGAAWFVREGTWNDIIVNVTSLTVAAEMISGDEVVRLDNIHLGRAPDPVTECALTGFEVSQFGWSAVDASLVIIANDGDPGDFLRVTESEADGRLVFPSWYGGDWSTHDGVGSVSLSITFIDDPIAGGEIRVDLSGPGGAANVSVPTDDFVPNRRFWSRLSWPIDAGSWNVTAGTWAGLIADVQEISLTVDPATDGDRYGVDNILRGGASCVVPPDPITFHEPGYVVCEVHRFKDASALARNPLDGRLYTLVNVAASSGGGVYPVTGPDAGLRYNPYASPTGLVFTEDGAGFVTENVSGQLFRFDGADSSSVWGSAFHTGDDDLAGLLVAPPGFEGPNVGPGDLLVTDHGSSSADGIWVASPDTAHIERELVPDPGSVDWWDITTDGQTVWACDAVDDDVLSLINPDGTFDELMLSQNILNMRAIAYDAGWGKLYALQTSSPLGLYRIDPIDGQVTLVADGFGDFGYGNLEVDSAARRLWVSDRANSRIYEICLPSGTVAVGETSMPVVPPMLALRPNPFRSGTVVSLDLPYRSEVRVGVIDATGRRVRLLEDGILPAGVSRIRWDGRDRNGSPVAAGVYFIRSEAAGVIRSAKAVVVR